MRINHWINSLTCQSVLIISPTLVTYLGFPHLLSERHRCHQIPNACRSVSPILVWRRERCIRHNLCLYFSLPGHMRPSCPTHPSRNSSAVSQNLNPFTILEISVTLRVNGKVMETTDRIDWEREILLILNSSRLKILLVLCESRLALAALDGHPLGSSRIHFTTKDLLLCTGALHKETIHLFVFQSPQTPIILGLPWLEGHNPSISWTDRQIIQWS